MLTLLFLILLIVVFGKLLIFGIKATWGISKFLFSLVLLPLALIGLVLKGFLYVALPVLLIVGVIAFLKEA